MGGECRQLLRGWAMISRRDILGVGAAALVVGFSTSARAWVGSGEQRLRGVRLPALDGELLTDPASLALVSQDAGYSQTVTPLAVLKPGSVRDIEKMVDFCRCYGISVSARGQGHTTFGQGLNRGGLIIDMGTLSAVHHIGARSATVEAGLKWSDLLTQTLSRGLTPPVLTGYIGLSVGGTLSVGGISSTNRVGAQVDRVQELEIVTGRGQRVVCSPRRNRDLFEGALAGLGQLGIITQATIELVPAPSLVRVYTIDYQNPAAFFADLRVLLRRGEFEDCYNFGIPDGNGGWIYQLTLAKHFEPNAPPNAARLLRGLSAAPSSAVSQDMPFSAYSLRVDLAVEFFRGLGLWEGVQHPWFDLFLPDRTVERYVTEVTRELEPEDVGATGFLLLFPQRRANFSRSLLRVPDCTEWFFLFDILTAAPSPGFDPVFDRKMRQRNRRLYDRSRPLGGVRYPIGTLDFDKRDWQQHYGSKWGYFSQLKRTHDPSRILTPGPGIF